MRFLTGGGDSGSDSESEGVVVSTFRRLREEMDLVCVCGWVCVYVRACVDDRFNMYMCTDLIILNLQLTIKTSSKL